MEIGTAVARKLILRLEKPEQKRREKIERAVTLVML
jgi:hypothetical protein